MAEQRYYEGVGRRKRASARVRVYPGGKGEYIVNDKPLREFFPRDVDVVEALKPLRVIDGIGKFDVTVQVKGGGITGQAGAVRMGLARALVEFNENNRRVMRKAGYLTRDAREKERKKPGLKRARKAPTYTKR
ncbi:MAG: 30S ribosomal protein S9 [Chloroflexi bacterium]|nr:30S ribosomal protein S9 [Chloroflexota bacterium]